MKSYNFLHSLSFPIFCAFLIATSGCGNGDQNKVDQSTAINKPQPADTTTPDISCPAEEKATPSPDALTLPVPQAPAADVKKPREPDAVLVTVDEATVTQADLDVEIGKMKTMMRNSGLASEQMEMLLSNMEPQIIEGLVIRSLLGNECAKRKVVVSDDDITAEIEQIKADLPKNLTLDKLLEQSGMTIDVFKNEMREQLKLKKLLDIAAPTDEQIKAYYEEHKEYFQMPEMMETRHILIKVEETDSDEIKNTKKQKAEDIRSKLKDGADFAKLAEENSDCPSKNQGGSLGNVRRGQMVAPFEEATFKLKAGETSEVVETQYGYHIIQAMEHTDAKMMPLEEAAPRIKAEIQSEGFRNKASTLIDELKSKAKITYSEGIEPSEIL